MNLQRVIGETIRSQRKRQSIQATELAQRVPISRAYLSEIEHGHKAVSFPMLENIAKGLDLETAELWGAIYQTMGAKNEPNNYGTFSR